MIDEKPYEDGTRQRLLFETNEATFKTSNFSRFQKVVPKELT